MKYTKCTVNCSRRSSFTDTKKIITLIKCISQKKKNKTFHWFFIQSASSLQSHFINNLSSFFFFLNVLLIVFFYDYKFFVLRFLKKLARLDKHWLTESQEKIGTRPKQICTDDVESFIQLHSSRNGPMTKQHKRYCTLSLKVLSMNSPLDFSRRY